MAGLSFWRSRSSRTALIVVLLLVSLATAGLIVIQAQYSASAQRAAAEGVLRDYSSLVADEVIRRSAVEVGYYGYSTLSAALVSEFQKTRRLSPHISADLLSTQDVRVKRAATLAKNYFQWDTTEHLLRFVGDADSEETPTWLQEKIAEVSEQRNDAPFQVIHSQPGKPARIFVTRSPCREFLSFCKASICSSVMPQTPTGRHLFFVPFPTIPDEESADRK